MIRQVLCIARSISAANNERTVEITSLDTVPIRVLVHGYHAAYLRRRGELQGQTDAVVQLTIKRALLVAYFRARSSASPPTLSQ